MSFAIRWTRWIAINITILDHHNTLSAKPSVKSMYFTLKALQFGLNEISLKQISLLCPNKSGVHFKKLDSELLTIFFHKFVRSKSHKDVHRFEKGSRDQSRVRSYLELFSFRHALEASLFRCCCSRTFSLQASSLLFGRILLMGSSWGWTVSLEIIEKLNFDISRREGPKFNDFFMSCKAIQISTKTKERLEEGFRIPNSFV